MLIGALLAVSCTSEPAATTTTSTTATTTTTTTTSTTTTTTGPETTTTVSEDQRIAEVTEIVRQVEFGWFDAIYRKDEAALADWVAIQKDFDAGVQLMLDDGFVTAEPTPEGLLIDISEILIDREDCLAVAYYGDATAFRGVGAEGGTTTVFWPRPSDGKWRSAYQGDIWDEACNEYTRENQLP